MHRQSARDAKYEYVSDQARFAVLCDAWSELPAIGLDTEFIRTRTFYAKVGLLQFAAESGCFLVDPLSISDWEPFRRLLSETQVIIHAAGEDLGLLHRLLGNVPANLFDTQLAAAFLGAGFSLSYRDLVSRFCDVELRKSETRSNWLQRPLSPSQLQYAADDVRFLLELREKLDADLRRKNAQDWFAEDCRRLRDGAEQDENPRTWLSSYLQIKDHNSLDDRSLYLLQQLCHWREREIRSRDLPRNWLVEDKDLSELARYLGKFAFITSDRIRKAPWVNPKFLKRFASSLAEFLAQQPSNSPAPRRNERFAPLDHTQRGMLKKCREAVSKEAKRIDVSPELLCRKKQLQQIVHSHSLTGSIDWPAEMKGWRQDVLAPALSEVLPAARANRAV
ncbi:MAG: ribonuclease D [Gammaproteobacteria bacterium]|nr:ribonuclease D [Gammaproteobacteria bacterium]MYC60491.1 ribonuclease D [Gammaproteobacteria bacterium]MYF01224.1 ribonuclease D [Gammaproteobacteria bacterium]